MQRLLSSLRLFVLILIISLANSNTMHAENVEVTKDFFHGFLNDSINKGKFVDTQTIHLTYDDKKFFIAISPALEANSLASLGSIRKIVNKADLGLIMYVDQRAFGGSVHYLDCCGINLTVKNKTNDVAILELNKSVISVGEYSGRPAVSGMKYNDLGSAVIPPIVIPPQKTVKKTLIRTDYTFVQNGAQSVWKHPASVFADMNVFGEGYFVFDFQQNNIDNYITMQACVIFPKDAFTPYLKAKKNKKS